MYLALLKYIGIQGPHHEDFTLSSSYPAISEDLHGSMDIPLWILMWDQVQNWMKTMQISFRCESVGRPLRREVKHKKSFSERFEGGMYKSYVAKLNLFNLLI